MFRQFSNPAMFDLQESMMPMENANSFSGNGTTSMVTKKAPVNNLSMKAKSKAQSPKPTKVMVGEQNEPIQITPFIESKKAIQDRYKKIIAENMDMKDIQTVEHVMSLNEAEQNTLLVSLTNRLYQMIVNKIDDIDFGEIPSTKGNIRLMSKHKQMRQCIEILHDIFVQYKEKPEPVDVIDNALSNLENNADLFMAAYAEDIKFAQMTYETTALGIVESLGFMIAVCIEYVKDPKKQGMSIILKKTGIMKVKNHLLYENLIKFNDACKNGDLERAIRPLIRNKVKNFDIVTTGLVVIHVALAIGVIVAAIIPFLRQMVYFFYATRVRMSTYLDAQADLLEMNANELKNNPHLTTVDDKNQVIARQLKIARLFHSTADKIAIDSKGAEVQATKELKEDDRKYKMDEVETNPVNTVTDGPLF